MRKVKKLLLKLIQFLYRNTADRGDIGFDIDDTPDPLFGLMSGTAVDRFLIEKAFETASSAYSFDHTDGIGIEVGDTRYLETYFKSYQKTKLSFIEGQPVQLNAELRASGDLTVPRCEITKYFDVVISTQVLVYVKDDLQAIKTFKEMMKPNALLIGSESLVAPLSIYDESRWGEHRRYSPRSLRALLEREFELIKFEVLGNAVSSAALVLGIPIESIDKDLISKTRWSHGTCMFYIAKPI